MDEKNGLNPFENQYYADIPRLSFNAASVTGGDGNSNTGTPGTFR